MKWSFRAHTLSIAALALLAASASWAAPPSSTRYQNSSYRTSTPARVSTHTASLLSEPEPIADPVSSEGPVEDGSLSWEDEGSCDSGCCNMPGVGLGGGMFRSGMWYGSVDYLLVRTHMSQATAEVRRTSSTDTTTTPTSSIITDQAIQYPFKYQSGFRAALGYRLLDCGGDIQVSYWRLQGNSNVSDGPANVTAINPVIIGNVSVKTESDGNTFTAATGVTANIFDVDFAKCLSFGGPKDPCDACFCPRWDMRWWAGARIADVSRYNNNMVADASGTPVEWGNIDARFVGAGPRVGVQGRRFFGACGNLALFARASQSILLGDYNMDRVSRKLDIAPNVQTITNVTDKYTRLVPVTDIEVGGSWQAAPYLFISAGWFFQCWWDLGQAETINTASFGPLDTSNILGFEGLFVRGEMLF